MVFQEIVAKVAIDFFSYIKIFENKAFGHVTEVPNYEICHSYSSGLLVTGCATACQVTTVTTCQPFYQSLLPRGFVHKGDKDVCINGRYTNWREKLSEKGVREIYQDLHVFENIWT